MSHNFVGHFEIYEVRDWDFLLRGISIEDMEFWFGFSYDEMKAVDFFGYDRINPNGNLTIREMLEGGGSSMSAICSVSFSVAIK